MGSDGLAPVLALVVAALATGIGFAVWRLSRRRAAARLEGFKRQAMLMGYTFQGEVVRLDRADAQVPDNTLNEALKSLQLFKKGRRPQISHVMGRSDGPGHSEWIFDFRYETGAGNNRSVVRQTVIGRYLGNRTLPEFTVEREGFLARLFDGADIDFEQDEVFSKAYLLKGSDEHAIKRRFTPPVRSFLTDHRDWGVEAGGGWIFQCRKGKLVAPDDLPTFLADFHRFLDLLEAGI